MADDPSKNFFIYWASRLSQIVLDAYSIGIALRDLRMDECVY